MANNTKKPTAGDKFVILAITTNVCSLDPDDEDSYASASNNGITMYYRRLTVSKYL